MGEAKRRKLKDSTFGVVPKKKLNQTPKTPFVKFIKFNGEFYAGNHNPLPGEPLFKPVPECNQYHSSKLIMDTAVNDLISRPDGAWLFAPTLGWKRADLSVPEIFEIAKHDETVRNLIGLNTPMSPATYDDCSHYRLLPSRDPLLDRLLQYQNDLNRSDYGTIYQPALIRISAIVISSDSQWLYCQDLNYLQAYKVKPEYFYPHGHPANSMGINVFIDRFEKIDLSLREAEYHKSIPIEVA